MQKTEPAITALRTRIKICGITEVEHARRAVEAGVDALGFIFVRQSPRNVEPERVRQIVATLPPFVDAVGVFVDEAAEVVEKIADFCALTMVQLHGSETPQYCAKMSRRVLKSFRLGAALPEPGDDFYALYAGVVQGFLLDTYHKKKAGGTGQPFDWSLVERYRPPGPVILAGGISPANVAQAIERLHPFAVDVNSGVETAPGKKSGEAILRLVAAVRAADQKRTAGQGIP
ncbi:MAG: phosphoribosylanthranilate isomerase [Deltaproteobacteria bacterium]